MKDEIFIDSNILIYAVSQNSPKCDIARQLLMENVEQITVSSQVIKEMAKLIPSTNCTPVLPPWLDTGQENQSSLSTIHLH